MDARRERSEFTNAKFDSGWALRFAPDQDAVGGGRHLAYGPRALIIDEGDDARSIYEVLEGGVLLFKRLPDGRRQIIEVLGVGDVFGLSPTSLSDSGAEALTGVRLAVHDRRAVDADPALRDRLFARLRAQLCALHDHALLLGRKSAKERIATFLMRLVPGRGGPACAGPARGVGDIAKAELAMTRQEIADYLGLTIETVSRAFTQLKREGIIAYDRQDEVAIPNVCRLCRLTGAH